MPDGRLEATSGLGVSTGAGEASGGWGASGSGVRVNPALGRAGARLAGVADGVGDAGCLSLLKSGRGWVAGSAGERD